jgi:serine/threonine protein kinase
MPANRKPAIFYTTFNFYTIVEPLGEGGAGRVYKVSDEEGKLFALKFLNASSTQQRKRFKNEIAFCSKKSSPRIVAVLDHGFSGTAEDRCPFYVMPLYAGTLRSLMNAEIGHDAVLPLFSQMLDGVEAAHLQDVVHRDLKPENILYDPPSNGLVIADFGIAQFTQEALFTAVETRAQERLANFIYAAPEQRRRGIDVGFRADIYALGLILNEMFTGEVLQGTGHKLIGGVAPQYAYLDPLVGLMVRHSASDRPASIADIKRELIARGADFVSQQRLSQLKGTVISAKEIDDPLIASPIKPVGVTYADDSRLEFELDRTPTPEWVRCFVSLGSYRAVMGSEPQRFQFSGNRAFVPLAESQIGMTQMVADNFKNYVHAANQGYRTETINAQRRRQEHEERALKERIAREEALQKIRDSVKSIKL